MTTTTTTSQATQTTKITVGMGATIYGYSDAHACTVIAVSKSGKEVTLRQDIATLLNGATSGEPDALKVYPGGFCAHVTGVQRYSYADDPNGTVRRFSLRTLKNGDTRWIEVGQSTKGGTRAILGKRAEHYDFNF